MFEKVLERQIPRLLTQACRDPHSPFYGCFDRNWWHYRIRDFASVMLQQGGYTAYLYGQTAAGANDRSSLNDLARASALFWDSRASSRGAFEEYYPWEQGYPPLAFSTLAMAKLVSAGIVDADDLSTGLKKAARQLQHRFESQAGNQQVAGLAALAEIRKVAPGLVNEEKYIELKKRTLTLQNSEGWYTEYDGPDLGYLSVTADCLWDLYDSTADSDYLDSATRALEFMHGFISRRLGGAGMHNARNTDYIVPYGISRFLEHEDESLQQKSREIIRLVYSDMDNRNHFFHAIDDRYWSHYIGHSVARAQLLIEKAGKSGKAGKTLNAGKTGKAIVTDPNHTYGESGYLFRELQDGKKRLLVSVKKGGLLTVYGEQQTYFSDFGWIAEKGKKQFVNHWWSDQWSVNVKDESIEVTGQLFPHKEKTSTPFLHFGLRVVSFLFGSVLTRVLRNVLIFKSGASKISFNRKIDIGPDAVTVTDEIEGIDKQTSVSRAPRASKRHVASADSWQQEDWQLADPGRQTETIMRKDGGIVVTTIYAL